MSWNPHKRRSPAQKAQAIANIQKVNEQRRNKENIPLSPQAAEAPAARRAPPPDLVPSHYLRTANEKLTVEHDRSSQCARKLRNAEQREQRLRKSKDDLKAKLKAAQVAHHATEAKLKAIAATAQARITDMEAEAEELEEEKRRAGVVLAEAEARSMRAEERMWAAEERLAYVEARAQVANGQMLQMEGRVRWAEEETRAAHMRAIAAEEDAGQARARAQAADEHTHQVVAQYSCALRELAVDMCHSSEVAVATARSEAAAVLEQAEICSAHAIDVAHQLALASEEQRRVAEERMQAAEEQARVAEERCRAAEHAVDDAWTRAAAAVEAIRAHFAAHAAQLSVQAQTSVSSIVYIAQMAMLDMAAHSETALEEERLKVQVAEAHTDVAVAEVENRLLEAVSEADEYLSFARHTLDSHSIAAEELTALRGQLEDSLEASAILRDRIVALSKQNKALKNQVRRAHQRVSESADRTSTTAPTDSSSPTMVLKHKGVIPDTTRNLIHDLVSLGLKVHQVRAVIEAVAGSAGVSVEGSISDRSVERIVLEGLVASELQVAVEGRDAEGITISSDGTTHKNVNYDSRHMHFNSASSSAHDRRFVGIQSAPNHTSDTQLNGWKARFESLVETYNASPLAGDKPLDTWTYLQKVYGLLTDHAEDQKRLKTLLAEWKTQCDREVRGKRAIEQLAPLDLLPILAEEVATAVESAGGADAWAALMPEEINIANLEIRQSMIARLGEAAYSALPEPERQLADLFIHAGCCMHKELNAVKGGNTRMMKFWSAAGLQPPVLLMNRDNDAAARSGASAAAARATEKSCGGAVKLAELAGALFRHKDNKKGQQDATRYFFEAALGERFTFPDTSNTRYQSYCEAAGELVVHLQLYRDFLELVRDKKTTGAFNHMERNVYAGLHDIPTLTELCVLALYGQSICHPYMRDVRGPQDGLTNHLDMGPLHERLKAYMTRIIADPDILLAPDASHTRAALDGEPWERPAVITSVHALAPSLPHLRGALVEFFTGALATWERFTAEFAPGGTIANLSTYHRSLAWMPTTNDENEGALGSWRNTARAAPSISLHQHNARSMYKMNRTSEFVSTSCGPAEQKFFRQRAREIDGAGLERKRRLDLATENENSAKRQNNERLAKRARKTARRTKLAQIQPVLDVTQLTIAKTNEFFKEQLAWHHEFIDTGPRADKKIPMVKTLTSKELRLAALIAAVHRYNAAPPASKPWLDVGVAPVDDAVDEEDDDDDEL
ncbi:hypothetical protein ONZ51_g2649 [Trametes cubensis]|uniref:Uncharacterized protein n=1 Tax=Trametes cubensis TaxID=1111947 RepID=A0AAD7U1Y9_9APHY|nr:hypothetical protein ONZ51_g2649 [Trametes cubensis]